MDQLEWLERDLALYRELLVKRQDLFGPLGDLRDKPRQNLHAVVIDLYWTAIHHGLGVVELLREELRAPLGVVQRALFETVVSLKYLVSRPDPVFEAVVYRAYSMLKELKFFPHDRASVTERREILAQMPSEPVREAKKRVEKRQNWSGQNMRVMAERVGFSGYDLYGWLSEEAHSRVIGYHFRLEKKSESRADLHFGRSLSRDERENLANFTRRMVNQAFMEFWSTFKGGPIQLGTSDPYKWVVDTGGFEPPWQSDSEGAENGR